eukprot:Em0014g405a
MTFIQVTKSRQQTTAASSRTLKTRCSEMQMIRSVLSAGEPTALIQREVLTLSDEERRALLDKAGILSTIEIGAAETLAIKAGLAIPWNKLRLLRRWLKSSGICLAGEERMRQISCQIVGDNLKGEIAPFSFPLPSGGEEVKGSPLVYIPHLVDMVIHLLDENERAGLLTWHDGYIPATGDSVTNLHVALDRFKDQVEHLHGMKWRIGRSKSSVFRAPVEVKAARLHSQLHVGCGIFDTLDTLARMDVGNQPGNSIEEYISSNFPGDARIERFVQEMRSSHLCHDLFNDAVPAVATKKKKKNCEPSAVQAPDGGIPATTESTTSIVSRLRQQINEWQRRMSDERLRSLQEDVHYELTDPLHTHLFIRTCLKPCHHLELSNELFTTRKYVAGAHHLQFVQNTYSKDQHGLRERDVDCRDKQNFDSVLRITSSSVMAQISQIPDAKGMLGLLRRLHRLQIQFRLEAESAQNGSRYPHCEKHKNKDGSNRQVTFSLQGVTDADIEDAVECGRKLAMKDIEMLGMELSLERDMEVETESAGSIIPEVDEDDDELDDDEPPRSDVNEELLKEACCAVAEDEDEVMSSLHDLKSAKLIEGDLHQQLVQMQEAVSLKKVSGTSLPIYTKNPVQSSKATTKFSRFVEVNHIGGTIYIHKTTAVWLFQEGERVSADRLFRVRQKQPYSCITIHTKEIRISDSNAIPTTCEVITEVDEQIWVKCGAVTLTKQEKDRLIRGHELSDTQINFA